MSLQVTLPSAYLERMKDKLGESYNAYLDSFQQRRTYGLRLNTLKIAVDDFKKAAPWDMKQIPWIQNGFFYLEDMHPTKHPYYFAGLYYIQEPSAMTPASLLPINEGDYVLDLCAAPGGKSTELGSRLQGTGMLVSNDISATRAKGLLKNIEVSGIRNCIVTCENSNKLAEKFPQFFDKILVDAPCSGEGMFRKDPHIIKAWEEDTNAYYVGLQQEIIRDAAKMLKPGGYLLYSTCTFAPEENEGIIQGLIQSHEEFSIEELPQLDGFDTGKPSWIEGGMDDLRKTIRLWPHNIDGEGHFIALLKKKDNNDQAVQEPVQSYKKTTVLKETHSEIQYFYSFIEQHLTFELDRKRIRVIGDKIYCIPNVNCDLAGLRILRSGWYLGELKSRRFEPSPTFAIGLRKEDFVNTINLTSQSIEVQKYLKGETLEVAGVDGWNLICVDGHPLGFGKLTSGRLKNKYNQNWRLQ